MMRLQRFVAVALWAGAVPAMGTTLAAQSTTTRVAANVTAAPPLLDTAITQLETFLDRYPTSTLRPNALLQLGELLVQRADEEFAASQRASGMDSTGRASIKPNYSQAIARYEELVRRYPTFEKIDAAQYTLGTLYASE